MRWRHPSLTFVNAQVLAPEGRICHTLRVSRGKIDGLDVAPARHDLVLDLQGAVLAPGLINAHDHLELNSFPRLKWRERYQNVREWIADFQPRFADDPGLAHARPDTLHDRLWVGGLKNLLAGATTVCHHNPLHAPLRTRFPVRVIRQYGISHSLLIDGQRVVDAYQQTPPAWPWIIHAAEGVDAEAAAEIDELDALGCLGPNTVIVHGVAICGDRALRLLAGGTSLIWCPTSNTFLFGATTDVRAFDDGGRLALGSDSRLSGEGDLLDELRAAHATRQISAKGAVRAVTSGAADVLRLSHGGRLGVGLPADLVAVRALMADPYDSLTHACRTDVRLVMINGESLVAEPSLAPMFSHLRVAAAAARLDGSPRIVAGWIAKRVRRLQLPEPGFEVAAC